jgi:hypothetical protein
MNNEKNINKQDIRNYLQSEFLKYPHITCDLIFEILNSIYIASETSAEEKDIVFELRELEDNIRYMLKNAPMNEE